MQRGELTRCFLATRSRTEALAAPLADEDQLLQAMPSASPVKWHRGHTTWFFETFVLMPHGFPPHEARWATLFNSYYEALGPRHARPQRGILSRPTCAQITEWRRLVDARMVRLLETGDLSELGPWVQLGIAHEEQHQELILTDLLSAFAQNPLRPVYDRAAPRPPRAGRTRSFVRHEGGIVAVGAAATPSTFAFDNEGPPHEVLVQPFALAERLVTVGEWCEFAQDRGYFTPSLWLSDGLDWVRAHGVTAPAYTRREGATVIVYDLTGEREAHPDEPILHLSFYEADALATFLGGRLPTEFEWEAAVRSGAKFTNLYDVGWQWTRSSYEPYPGFRAAPGAVGEYNGKFMVNQRVLRGGSIFTPEGHSRVTYRNFWPPDTTFQATTLRLAKEA